MWDKKNSRQGKAIKPKSQSQEFLSTYNNQTSGTLSHWFMPYKVEGGKSSFQCGTKRIQGKARQSSQKAKAKTKNS